MKKYFTSSILAVLTVVMIIPIWMLVMGSITGGGELRINLHPLFEKGSTEFVKWPILPDFIGLWGYIELLLDTPEFFVMFFNSTKMVLLILLLQMVVSVPAAWGFAQFKFKGKDGLFMLYIILMLMPFQVTMVSNYLVLDQLKLMDTLWAVILPAAFSTFTVFIVYRFFTTIPREMIEACYIDGGSVFQTFLYIGIPLGGPGIIAAMTLNFLEYWNMVEQPMVFLREPSQWPLALYLPTMNGENVDIGFAASVITLLPALLIFMCGQQYLEKGILSAALKE